MSSRNRKTLLAVGLLAVGLLLGAVRILAPASGEVIEPTAQATASASRAGTIEIPLLIDERLGVDSRDVPVRFGVPLPKGQLKEAGPFEVAVGEHVTEASTRVLSRWPDNSVKWLQVEALSPPVASGQRLEGRLRPRSGQAHESASQGVRLSSEAATFRVTTRAFEVTVGKTGPFLKQVRLDDREFVGAATVALETDLVGKDESIRIGEAQVEEQSATSVTFARVDTYLDGDGRPALEIIHRLTTFDGTPWIRWQQTLQVRRGRHSVRDWRVDLPLAEPGSQMSLSLANGQVRQLTGDFAARQVSADEASLDARSMRSRLGGALQWQQGALGLEYFWQLFPKGLLRRGNTVRLELAPPVDGRPVVLEEGFARTHSLWLMGGSDAASDTGRELPRLAASLRPRSTSQWNLASNAFDGMRVAESTSERKLVTAAEASAKATFARRERFSQWSFGLQHFGDFFDREHTLAYYGALNQEYDPMLALVMLYARTGEVQYLDWAVELAWHFADVDVAPSGGVFQHRATEDHFRSWITELMANRIQEYVRSHPRFDGSTESVRRIIDERQGAGTFQRMQKMVSQLTAGEEVPRQEQMALMTRAIAWRNLEAIEKDVRRQLGSSQAKGQRKPSGMMETVATAFASSPKAQKLGFDDAQRQFAPFFELYGGSWSEFPSFHVSNLPGPLRHSGDHSLVEGLVFAHWLTGEPRFREVALKIAEHHVDWLVDREIRRLPNHTFSRTVAWPLINLMRLWELTEGMPDEQDLHERIVRSAGDASRVLSDLNVSRHGGSIHAGITMEGLARYHAQTGDERVGASLVRLANQWAQQNYDARRKAFYLKSDDRSGAGPTMNGLVVYGLAYANALEPKPALQRIVLDAYSQVPGTTDYAKELAMRYRSTLRAGQYLDTGTSN